MRMLRSSVVLLGLAGMALATVQNLAVTAEEREAVLAMRREAGTVDPSMTTRDGNLVTSVGQGADVIFELGNETLSLNQLPADLRGYTNAAVDALDTGFRIGRAQGEAEGRNHALEAELRLLDRLSTLETDLSSTVSTMQSTSAAELSTMGAAQSTAAAEVSNTVSTLTATLTPAGLTANDPISSCMEMTAGMSAFYYVRPAAAPANSNPVRVWCDARWGGGWVQIFHGQGYQYKDQWTPANARRAYGGVPSPDASNATNPLSKLSDVFINQYLGLSATRNTKAVYRFSSDCHGPGSGRVGPHHAGYGMFIEANMRQYDDRRSGMGLNQFARPKYLYGTGVGKLYPPKRWSNGVFDTPHSQNHMLGSSSDTTSRTENNCMRWFNGHRGGSTTNQFQCYNPRTGSWRDSKKCFSHGNSCYCDGQGGHPQAQGVMIFAKTRADYGFKDSITTFRP